MPVLRNAKRTAWQLLLEDESVGGQAVQLDQLHRLQKLEDRYRSQGDYGEVDQTRKEIEELKNIPK